MPDCKSCKDKRKELTAEEHLRYAHDRESAFAERTVKRLWILLILMAVLLVGTNAYWIYNESQYDDVVTTTQEVTQSTIDGSNTFVGGDVIGNANG